ncbi:Ig-like domain-containing protein [Microbacterium sp. STN6]|uniref:Ig-like domain-containing protein n=1 Tax=Microbacterium sp. STN6 TaxID=2995588 RepID=UPI002260B84B|nr:Ig-like domain-containing protein [Microbacterium sp. STN6]MCX7521190.1 Ig-like domain-containing protein [Microbacterium sp. STN6]
MIRAWLAAHKSLAVTAVSSTSIVALVTTLALVSGGYPAQRMQLDDASVWVTSQSRSLLGRANTEISRLNTVVSSASSSTDVVQSGKTVLMVDAGENTVSRVNPATSQAGKSVPLPPRQPRVQLAGTSVAISSEATGQLWLTGLSQLADFTVESQPTLDLGGRSVTSIDQAGVLFAYLPETHQLRRVDLAAGTAMQTVGDVSIDKADDELSITSIGGHWALLDATTRMLYLDRGRVDLSDALAGATGAVLEQPATSGDTVYIASSAGLVSVRLDSGGATKVLSGSMGRPAAPTRVDGCVYAGWAGGTAWKTCGAASDGVKDTLSSMPGGAQLVYRVNGDRVVLNDEVSGTSWAVQQGNALIDNWDELVVKKDKTQQIEENNLDTPPEYEKTQAPPVAIDDSFGARPGRVSPLPVLMNDYDPNGDVLMITQVTPVDATRGRVDIVGNGQRLQLTLPADAVGTLSFDYTITDGRGGTASAHVLVTVRTPQENSPPQQIRRTKALVQAGGRVTSQVLGDWYDPDGDPFYLTAATVPAPDTVTYTPQGGVVFSDAGKGGTLKNVALVVSDSRAEGTGVLAVTVRPANQVPIIADPFALLATAGQEITVSPLAHVRGGTGALRLSAVPAKPDATITPDYEGGTFRFTSTQVGPHYVDYAVTDGVTTATGLVRIDVQAPPDSKTQPITVPHTAFIHAQSTQEVDVLATDIDPAGGVLLITGVTTVPAASGIRVEVLQQRILRVTLTRPLEAPVDFTYRVSNGLAEAEGTVTVIEIPQPAVRQPPVAMDDTVSVRVGDAIDIPVLDNDSQPDGDELTLDPTLVQPLPQNAGLLFVSGDRLRYLAPKSTGNFTATYKVSAPDGQWATAQVKIAVRELDAATNNAPVPKTVTARVLAGDTVRIPIPLTGIDPDGDSVQLLGQESNPAKGAVTKVGSDWIDYEAGDYSAGTDTFGYTVVDALGARATGIVRVGIATKLDGARNPVAVEDEVTVRPSRTVSVQVLANDSDPDNSPLTVTNVTSTTPGIKATTDGELVTVTAPATEGRYGFIYEISNERGGTSSNFLTVIVAKNAPLSRPIANDTVLALSDILGRTSVDVDVLANVFFADGPVSRLGLSVLPGYGDTATVTSDKRIRVTIENESQIIPFAVRHPDDSSIVSYAFIWVPGFDDALPQLKRGARDVTVASESTVTINLGGYVVAAGGKKVMLTDASTVRATHSNGDNLVKDSHTLVFTSADRYFGPASISFEVTDGTSPSDPNGHTATLVLPITVTPRENQPPVFTGGLIDFEPGQQKTIDLVKLTRYPYQKDQGELTYTVLDPKPKGFSVSLSGQKLDIDAAESTPKGAVATVLVGVKDAINAGQAGRIQLTVVPSTRPLAVPAADSAIVQRGTTKTVDVLANDAATNPFPKTPLRVVAVRGIGSDALPPGVSVTPSADKSTLTVSVSANAQPIDTNLQYEVADATGDPDRYAWGTVRISVQDRPDPVQNLQLTGISDQKLTFSWVPGAFNNSPITDYQVTTTRASDGSTNTTTCAATSCTVPTSGNGPDNQVRVSVTAKNALGISDAVAYPDAVWSNIVPAAPSNLATSPLDGGLHITWDKPPATPGASAVTSYLVTVADNTTVVSAGTYAIDVGNLTNGTQYTVSVASRNAFYGATNWNQATATGVPAGPPQRIGNLTAAQPSYGSTSVNVNWPGVFDGNGRGITKYAVAAYSGGSGPTCRSNGTILANGATVHDGLPASTTADTFSGLSADTPYSFVAFAYNGQGCTASNVAMVSPHVTPGPITAFNTHRQPDSSSQTTFDFILDSVTPACSPTMPCEYRVDGANSSTAWQAISVGGTISAGTGNYGQPITVHLRRVAVYDDGAVRLPSDEFAKVIGTPVDTKVGGLHFENGDFSWTQAPASYTSVQYSCDAGVTKTSMPAAGAATNCVSGLLTVYVQMNDSGGSNLYTKTYRSTDYDQ